MQHDESYTRRRFLGSAAAAGLAWTAGGPALAAIARAAAAAGDSGAPFAVLADDDARDFAAMAARIIPTTDTPGATEAGVIHFFDQAFAREMAGDLPFALSELAALNRDLDGRFAGLDTGAQDALLRDIEQGPFFQLMRVMTIYGFFAMSRYGGNRDQVGWKLIGFEGHHGPWSHPFGYYDAEATREAPDGQ
jgi:gluconate 2-dehydrogenase gamma chain